jgi:hypothetical protein
MLSAQRINASSGYEIRCITTGRVAKWRTAPPPGQPNSVRVVVARSFDVELCFEDHTLSCGQRHNFSVHSLRKVIKRQLLISVMLGIAIVI